VKWMSLGVIINCEVDVFGGCLTDILVIKVFVVLWMYLDNFVKCHAFITMRIFENINLLFWDVSDSLG